MPGPKPVREFGEKHGEMMNEYSIYVFFGMKPMIHMENICKSSGHMTTYRFDM